MGVGTYGIGTPTNFLAPSQIPWGLSPASAVGINPFAAQQFYGPSAPQLTSTMSPYAAQPLQQLQQLLQLVPQQLQQLLQLQYLQQHQLQQIHQLVQSIPQHLQPFAQLTAGAGAPGLTSWGVSPHIFGAQPGSVM